MRLVGRRTENTSLPSETGTGAATPPYSDRAIRCFPGMFLPMCLKQLAGQFGGGCKGPVVAARCPAHRLLFKLSAANACGSPSPCCSWSHRRTAARRDATSGTRAHPDWTDAGGIGSCNVLSSPPVARSRGVARPERPNPAYSRSFHPHAWMNPAICAVQVPPRGGRRRFPDVRNFTSAHRPATHSPRHPRGLISKRLGNCPPRRRKNVMILKSLLS